MTRNADNTESPRFWSKRIGFFFPIGFAAGLPYLLSGGTLLEWLTDLKVDIKTLTWFAAVHLPFSFKFVWAPILDRYVPPFLGRRRGWIAIFQIAITLVIALMGAGDIGGSSAKTIALWAVMLSFVTASHDIVIDAYRTDVLEQRERGKGAAAYVFGYRAAMIVAGSVTLLLADYLPWSTVYMLMAGLMATSLITTLVAPDVEPVQPPKTLREAVVEPFVEFMKRRGALLALVFILFYKIADAFAGAVMAPFLRDATTVVEDLQTRAQFMSFLIEGGFAPVADAMADEFAFFMYDGVGIGFSRADVAIIRKFAGMAASLAGVAVGGIWIDRIGVKKGLLYFCFVQAAANVGYVALALVGKSKLMLTLAICTDNFCNGLGTAALVVFLMTLCSERFSAAQYALFTGISSMLSDSLKVYAGSLFSVTASWPVFFGLTVVMAVPAVVLAKMLRDPTKDIEYVSRHSLAAYGLGLAVIVLVAETCHVLGIWHLRTSPMLVLAYIVALALCGLGCRENRGRNSRLYACGRLGLVVAAVGVCLRGASLLT